MDLFIAMRTFVEVVQAGSMNAAAQKLNVTSALVGQRIGALEDHLQVRLLNRTTRRHSLTDFGESYLAQCRDILELVAQSEGKASDQQAQPQGRLRIAAPLSFGSEALMPALKSFTDRCRAESSGSRRIRKTCSASVIKRALVAFETKKVENRTAKAPISRITSPDRPNTGP